MPSIVPIGTLINIITENTITSILAQFFPVKREIDEIRNSDPAVIKKSPTIGADINYQTIWA